MACNCGKNKAEFAKRLEAAKLAGLPPPQPPQPLSSTSPEAQNNPTLKRYLLRVERLQARALRMKKREMRIQRRKAREEQDKISEQAVIDKKNSVQSVNDNSQTPSSPAISSQ